MQQLTKTLRGEKEHSCTKDTNCADGGKLE